jgi:hypothetical protein
MVVMGGGERWSRPNGEVRGATGVSVRRVPASSEEFVRPCGRPSGGANERQVDGHGDGRYAATTIVLIVAVTSSVTSTTTM